MPRLDSPDDFLAPKIVREAAQNAWVKAQFITKLKENGVLSEEQIQQFHRHAVDHSADKPLMRRTRLQHRDIEREFNDMDLGSFTRATAVYIRDHVPNDRCIQVYEDVLSVLPSSEEMPAAREPAVNPREKPETAFSVSRAAPESRKSNAELIDALASAIDMEPGTAIGIRGQITMWDSIDDETKMGGILAPYYGLVGAGRLGRAHMLGDVPNPHVRDRLMDYINIVVQEDRRECARRAVFSDLAPAELEEYSAVITRKRIQEEAEATGSTDLRTNRVLGNRAVRRPREAANAAQQGAVLDKINEDIDLTPKPGFGFRDYDCVEPISRSVVKPGLKELDPSEADVEVGKDIDRDCDQIRAMIARFTNGTEWTVDRFRLALGGISRPQLTTFLKKKGPAEGKQTMVFQLAWEFFKKRELLGLPLTRTLDDDDNDDNSDGGDDDVLQPQDGNRRRKRPSAGGENDKTGRKRTRTSGRRS
ncbi:hypothetical protein AAE478_003191 [Parahypoxylon ruwenzoriense]